jgi:membrane dipeptidase
MTCPARGWHLLLARACVAAAMFSVVGGPAVAQGDAAALEHAKQLLKKSILFDGHNDLPWAIRSYEAAPGDLVAYDLRARAPGQTDLPRLREGRLGAQFWSVYVPGEMAGSARMQLEQIDLARRMIERYPDAFRFAATAADVRAAHRAGRIGSMLGIEGGHAIENSLGALRAYYDLGVRYMTLTHNTHTAWADSAAEVPARFHGLSAFGEEVVREMNRLGMLVDLAHVSPETMDDALRVSRAPVIFSHSAARALCDVPRNVPDEILRRLPANGGVLMVTFVSGFIDPEVDKVMGPAIREYNRRAREAKSDADLDQLQKDVFGKLDIPPTSIAKVADHIEYVRKIAGVRHVGIGGDYDGNTEWPTGLEDVSGYPKLFAELIRRGWSDEDLTLLAGENVLRALEQAEHVAATLRKTTPASVMQLNK